MISVDDDEECHVSEINKVCTRSVGTRSNHVRFLVDTVFSPIDGAHLRQKRDYGTPTQRL